MLGLVFSVVPARVTLGVRRKAGFGITWAAFRPIMSGPNIDHHMRLAGATRPIFSEQAVGLLATLTRDVPRLINAHKVSCLLDTWSRDQKVVVLFVLQRDLSPCYSGTRITLSRTYGCFVHAAATST